MLEKSHKHIDEVEIVLVVEGNKVLLPKLLSVNWTPSEMTLVDFFFELINRAEHLAVLIQVQEQLVKQISNVFVNPVSILKLNDQVDQVDVGHDLKTVLVLLELLH